ncbi:hypothetical protein FALBO_3893 [Fusarium albosuccineum]|uniref:DUF5071 domain-containing protein n=1 Tax=Fusarium albosuccineum TaxID=1237068 RepID=A0A8H4LGG2_9HYPO|nr:hypothetical protein FALBO_3893 [Fusarium albosuccineum]
MMSVQNTSDSQDARADTDARGPDLLASLDAEAFGARVPAIISTASHETFAEVEIIRARATEAPTVAAVSNMITSPKKEQNDIYLVWTVLNEVIVDLPLEVLQLYRPALKTLSETAAPDTTASHYQGATGLIAEATFLIRFIDDPNAVWVPETKGDRIGLRSLRERVKTADEMRPYVPDLLDWLADPNWPPFRECWAQLARFPEVTVGPIGELIKRVRGDGGWIVQLLYFVGECVPFAMQEELRPVVKSLVDESKGDEDEWEISEVAREWLGTLDTRERIKQPTTTIQRQCFGVVLRGLTSVAFVDRLKLACRARDTCENKPKPRTEPNKGNVSDSGAGCDKRGIVNAESADDRQAKILTNAIAISILITLLGRLVEAARLNPSLDWTLLHGMAPNQAVSRRIRDRAGSLPASGGASPAPSLADRCICVGSPPGCDGKGRCDGRCNNPCRDTPPTYPAIMGNNLSSTFVPDTSGVVLSPEDRGSAIKLGIFWAVSLYGCAMIFSTCALIDRWKGPYDRIRTTPGSVFGAVLLSTAWPVVMAYLIMSADSA